MASTVVTGPLSRLAYIGDRREDHEDLWPRPQQSGLSIGTGQVQRGLDGAVQEEVTTGQRDGGYGSVGRYSGMP